MMLKEGYKTLMVPAERVATFIVNLVCTQFRDLFPLLEACSVLQLYTAGTCDGKRSL